MEQTPKPPKGDVYVGIATVLFRFTSDAELLAQLQAFSVWMVCRMLLQPDISAWVYPVKNCKVDPFNTIAEGFGRYVLFGFDVLACLLSAHLRSALTVGVYMCRASF